MHNGIYPMLNYVHQKNEIDETTEALWILERGAHSKWTVNRLNLCGIHVKKDLWLSFGNPVDIEDMLEEIIPFA